MSPVVIGTLALVAALAACSETYVTPVGGVIAKGLCEPHEGLRRVRQSNKESLTGQRALEITADCNDGTTITLRTPWQ